QTSNNYIQEWLDYKESFLQSLLNIEAPPNLRQCSMCDVVSSYRCSNCFSQPMYCMACCQNHHRSQPFHQIEQWTGLGLISYALYLGHNRHPCPEANNNKERRSITGSQHRPEPTHADQNTALSDDEQAWTDMDAIPLHLHPPSNNDYITIVDVSGIHFITIRYCECLAAPAHYLQLLNSKLFLATILKPRTALTFRVLDDFIRDNCYARSFSPL
ncbi:hypothetical protein V8E55_006994, partial [Tylopilus felleus]